mgnify:CR=1 FL=1
MYRLRGHAPTSNDGYLFGHNRPDHARSENRKRSPPEVLHSVAQHRGAAHPLCFTDEVMEHEFPDGFKPINIKSYMEQQIPRYGLRITSSIFTWLAETTFMPLNTYP